MVSKCSLSVLERCLSSREFNYNKMTGNGLDQLTPGVHLKAVFIKRELTVEWFSKTLSSPIL